MIEDIDPRLIDLIPATRAEAVLPESSELECSNDAADKMAADYGTDWVSDLRKLCCSKRIEIRDKTLDQARRFIEEYL